MDLRELLNPATQSSARPPENSAAAPVADSGRTTPSPGLPRSSLEQNLRILECDCGPCPQLSTEIKCCYCDATGPSLHRNISPWFGRDTVEWVQNIPKDVWVYCCNKHYLEIQPRKGETNQLKRMELILRQFKSLQAWSEENKRKHSGLIIRSWSLCKRGQSPAVWLKELMGSSYTAEEILEVAGKMHNMIRVGLLAQVPEIEFVPDIDYAIHGLPTKKIRQRKPRKPLDRLRCEFCPRMLVGERKYSLHMLSVHEHMVGWQIISPEDNGQSRPHEMLHTMNACLSCETFKLWDSCYNAANHLRQYHFRTAKLCWPKLHCLKSQYMKKVHIERPRQALSEHVAFGNREQPSATNYLKSINHVKKQLHAVAKSQQGLTDARSSKNAVWTLASIMLPKLPEADIPTKCCKRLFSHQLIHVEAYLVHFNTEVAYKLTTDTINALIQYHREVHCVNAKASSSDWPGKEQQCEKLHEDFVQALDKFLFRTHVSALEVLEEDGAGELICGKSEEAKNNILSLIKPLVPAPPRPAPSLPHAY